MDDIKKENDGYQEISPDSYSQTSFDGDVSLDDVLTKQAQNPEDEEKSKKRAKHIKYGVIGGVLLIILLMLFSCQAPKGPMEYGVCATFLELTTPYPNTLNFKDVEGSQTTIRIYYTSIDPFGQYKEEMIECRFRSDKWELLEVSKNRRPVDPAAVAKFNLLIPSIVAGEPNLNLPPYWENPLNK